MVRPVLSRALRRALRRAATARGLARAAAGTVLVTLAALVALAAVVVGPAGEAAAACPRPAPAVAAQRATAVFTGVVTGTLSGDRWLQTIRVDRVYKGQVTSAEVRVRTSGGRCGLGRLTPDERYVVMATPDGDSWLAGPRSGTAPVSDQLLMRLQSLFGQGTAPARPAPPAKASYDKVAGDHPRPFLRVAAPGFALVIVGLLGLVVSRRWRHGATTQR